MKTLQLMPGGLIPLDLETAKEVRLLEYLGSGGFAQVWKVEEVKRREVYALKIAQGLTPGSVDLERMRLEAEVRIKSDHVVQALGIRQWDEYTCLILFEYFPGRSLREVLPGGLNDDEKREVFMQILRGVADAHRCNVVHRDLKPENILIGKDADGRLRAKLIDFGIAKFKDSKLTSSGVAMGTPAYMAPEIFFDGSSCADARSDIYSLGQLLYELAMGERFWTRRGFKDLEKFAQFLAHEMKSEDCIDLGDFRCSMFAGKDVKTILARMVKFHPEDRYASVQEVLAEFGAPVIPRTPRSYRSLRYPLLVVESGSNRNARTMISIEDGERRVIGRYDIAGADRSISSEHLEFTRYGDEFRMRDLGSKNGTFVMGLPMRPQDTPRLLRHNDRIKVGDIFLRFVNEEEP